MKKIGFIDYYISEWHANNYPGWIKRVCEKNGWDYQVCYAWAQKDISEVDGKSTGQWCAEYGVERCDSIAEIYEKSDYVIILAPSDPQTHLALTSEAFQYKKPTYVDKTFAPDADTARKIIALSERYGTPFFSTSALRYADELAEFAGAKKVSVKGGGGNLPEYIIHQIEMVVKTVGIGAKAVVLRRVGEDSLVEIRYDDDREARLCYNPQNAFAFAAEDGEGNCREIAISSNFFLNLIEKILFFFETGEVDFTHRETLEVMKIREAVIKAEQTPDKLLEV